MSDIPKDLRLLAAWFEELQSDEQKKILELTDKGLVYLEKHLKDDENDIFSLYKEFRIFTIGKLKESNIEEVNSLLKTLGFNDSVFRKSLVNQISNAMSLYFDAKFLRDINFNEFRNFVNTLIKDVFVNRKYNSYSRVSEELNIEVTEDFKKSIQTIKFILSIFFKANFSFERLSRLLEEDIDLSKEKSVELSEAILMHIEKLEKYFLFEQLREIKSSISEISVSLEDNKLSD